MIDSPQIVRCPECGEHATHKGTCRFSSMFQGPGKSCAIVALPAGWVMLREPAEEAETA